MIVRGHVKNGVVVPDPPNSLPEGAEVRVEVVETSPTGEQSVRRQGGWWKGQVHMAEDFDQLRDDIAEPLGMPIAHAATSFSPAEIAEALRRAKSDGPWYSTEEVIQFIESQEEPA